MHSSISVQGRAIGKLPSGRVLKIAHTFQAGGLRSELTNRVKENHVALIQRDIIVNEIATPTSVQSMDIVILTPLEMGLTHARLDNLFEQKALTAWSKKYLRGFQLYLPPNGTWMNFILDAGASPHLSTVRRLVGASEVMEHGTFKFLLRMGVSPKGTRVMGIFPVDRHIPFDRETRIAFAVRPL